MTTPDFRAAVRAAITEQDISQRELARQAGTSIQTLNAWLLGKASMASDTLQNVAGVLGLALAPTKPKRTKA